MIHPDDLFKPEYAAFKEALAAFEAFRRLGFSSDNISFVVKPEEAKSFIYMRLYEQDKDFIYGCGILPYKPEVIQAMWQAVGSLWNKHMTLQQRKAIYDKSLVRKQGVQLLIRLQEKGFKVPYENHPANPTLRPN